MTGNSYRVTRISQSESGDFPSVQSENGRKTVKANTTTRWVTVLVAAWLALPSMAQGQDRSLRNRVRIEQSMRSSARARVGISLDVRQSKRFDDQGALITDVLQGSPAWDEGLREGDVVTSFRGHLLTEALEAGLEDDFDERDALPVQRLLALAAEMEPEEIIEIRYTRDGESYVIEVEAEASRAGNWLSVGPEGVGIFRGGDDAGSREGRVLSFSPPDFEFSFGGLLNECPSGSNRFWSVGDGRGCVAGVELRELNPTLGEYFGTESGILVIDVDEDNPLGFMPGDVIVSVGDRDVDSLERVRRVLGSYDEDETVTVRIIRKGSEEVLRGTLR
jgi:PDZ domain